MEDRLSHGELLKLKRYNTPAIYNGWERLTDRDRLSGVFNREETRDFMPQMGPMVGYAVTVVIRPGSAEYAAQSAALWAGYRAYVASIDGPKIVVVQDLDKPETVGSFWGEVNSNVHRALGCVGTVTDGAVRDVDEMTNAGFKALARRMCVGHAYSAPIRWGCEVEVFGAKVSPGQLLHADKHGFMVIPKEDERGLYEASALMDACECEHIIRAARSTCGMGAQDALRALNEAAAGFQAAADAGMRAIRDARRNA